MLNTFVAGTMDQLPGDREFNDCCWTLVRAFDKNAWPALDELPEGLGVYRPLFETIGEPTAFGDAVVRLCDTAVERALGENGGREGPFIYQIDPWGLFPLDVLSFKAIREKISGQSVSLTVEHPMLQSPLSVIPDLSQPYEDDTTHRFKVAGHAWFGSKWQAWAEMPLYELDGA